MPEAPKPENQPSRGRTLMAVWGTLMLLALAAMLMNG